MSKKAVVGALLIIVIGVGGAFFLLKGDEASTETNENLSSSQPTSGCGAKGFACSESEIAKHNTPTDCWVIYKGNYYDVTSYVTRHEGGSAVFNDQTCGKDIQKYLEGQASSAGRTNNHPTSAYRDLERLLIGPVASN